VLRGSAPAFFCVVLMALLAAGALQAAPPETCDASMHGWFESLKQPGSGVSCCSIADCRPVDYRMDSNGYEALIEAKWVRVPDEKILHGKPNPTGRGVLCRSPISGTILCFVPASET